MNKQIEELRQQLSAAQADNEQLVKALQLFDSVIRSTEEVTFDDTLQYVVPMDILDYFESEVDEAIAAHKARQGKEPEMTMPTFEPVVHVYEDTLVHGVALPYGTQLFTINQLTAAFEAGKASQVEQKPVLHVMNVPVVFEETERDIAYDTIDIFLRNNLDDGDYAQYSGALDLTYAAPPAPAVPDGWKLVPKHPTQDMVEAISPLLQHPAVGMYKAMLAASPEPTKS